MTPTPCGVPTALASHWEVGSPLLCLFCPIGGRLHSSTLRTVALWGSTCIPPRRTPRGVLGALCGQHGAGSEAELRAMCGYKRPCPVLGRKEGKLGMTRFLANKQPAERFKNISHPSMAAVGCVQRGRRGCREAVGAFESCLKSQQLCSVTSFIPFRAPFCFSD